MPNKVSQPSNRVNSLIVTSFVSTAVGILLLVMALAPFFGPNGSQLSSEPVILVILSGVFGVLSLILGWIGVMKTSKKAAGVTSIVLGAVLIACPLLLFMALSYSISQFKYYW